MNAPNPSQRVLLGWLVRAHWRERPGSLLVAAVSIAIGVALALGVHLVNRSALAQFASALALVNGEAQAQILGRAGWLDEQVFVDMLGESGIAAASPVIEIKALVRKESSSSEAVPLKVLGLDPIRAVRVTPALMPSLHTSVRADSGAGSSPSPSSSASGSASDPAAIFADDALFLSRTAARELQIQPGDKLSVAYGDRQVALRFAGHLDAAGEGQALAVIDIGNAQHYFGLNGRLSRIDLRFDEAADAAALRERIERQLPEQALWSEPGASGQRMSNLSRAYRVNLNVLALVALFTGAFIVQATLTLRIMRQQREIALLGVLGAPSRLGAWCVLADALAIGLPGSVAGVAGGIGLAAALLRITGGDLGGGYFSSAPVPVALDPLSLLAGLLGGLLVALAGAWGPLRLARSITPASALRSGASEAILARRQTTGFALLLILAAALLAAAPPVYGLPLPSYAAIALVLLAGVMLSVNVIGPIASGVIRLIEGRSTTASVWLASHRLAGAPSSAAAMLGGVIASFALASAMAIMVTSFRFSVSQWLDQVLPADVYARLAPATSGSGFDQAMQAVLTAIPGARETEFSRIVPVLLDPAQPPVALVARPLHASGAGARLPLTGQLKLPPTNTPAIWISEAVVDLYRVKPGDTLRLPIGSDGRSTDTFISGVWRDYARQHGAIAIDLADYRALTGDRGANEVAWWLAPQTSPTDFIARARASSALADTMEFRDTAELKALSLRIFDRSFAITHALEAIAIAVALFGVASAVAGEALARMREFGMLRHLGLTRAQVGRQFSLEAAIGTAIAALWGLVLGAAVAWILVHRVNPQSFHWTMELHWPWVVLWTTGLAMVALAALTARLAARDATGTGPVRAVREDW